MTGARPERTSNTPRTGGTAGKVTAVSLLVHPASHDCFKPPVEIGAEFDAVEFIGGRPRWLRRRLCHDRLGLERENKFCTDAAPFSIARNARLEVRTALPEHRGSRSPHLDLSPIRGRRRHAAPAAETPGNSGSPAASARRQRRSDWAAAFSSSPAGPGSEQAPFESARSPWPILARGRRALPAAACPYGQRRKGLVTQRRTRLSCASLRVSAGPMSLTWSTHRSRNRLAHAPTSLPSAPNSADPFVILDRRTAV